MRVVVYDKIHEDGYREMGIWVGTIFSSEEACFRRYAVCWIHNMPRGGPGDYVPFRQPGSKFGKNLFYNPYATGFIHYPIRQKYGVDVFGRCVEFKVVWLEAL